MTVLNIMLGKRRGGLEQACLDYAEALAHGGMASITVTSPGAWVTGPLIDRQLNQHTLPNFGAWDPLAALALRRYARRVGATAVICHGNRAWELTLRALKGRLPVTVAAHNYRGHHFVDADAVFCITDDVRQHLLRHQLPNERLFFAPNMVRLPQAVTRGPFRSPPVIGSLGRLATVKGYDMFIEALALLKARGIAFRAVLGGAGEEEASLRALAKKHAVPIEFIGWVEDKHTFFADLDIFVLSSRSEPFGIVLIEAMAHEVPVVSFAVEGPREITADGVEALLVPPTDTTALADALVRLMADAPLASDLAANALAKVKRAYTLEAMAGRLKAALATITSST